MKRYISGTMDSDEKSFLRGMLTVLASVGRIGEFDHERLWFEANDKEFEYAKAIILLNFVPLNSDFKIT